jgi:hypothetical protein
VRLLEKHIAQVGYFVNYLGITRKEIHIVKLQLIVIIILIALLVGCGASLRPEVNTPVAASTPAPAITRVVTPRVLDNGWYQYTEPTIGYSFSYPPQTKVKIGQSRFGNHTAQLQFKLPDVTGYQGMVIRVQANPNDLPIDQILAQLYQQSTQEIAPEDLLNQVEVMTVAGQPALKTSILPLNTEFSILFLHHNRVYILAPVHGPTTSAVDPQALELFYQILETFAVKP